MEELVSRSRYRSVGQRHRRQGWCFANVSKHSCFFWLGKGILSAPWLNEDPTRPLAKAASSRNALKHGLRSEAPSFPVSRSSTTGTAMVLRSSPPLNRKAPSRRQGACRKADTKG